MFLHPFSFNGRIRRLEYGISYLLFISLYTATSFLWTEFEKGQVFFYLFYAILIWFFTAQSTKRCHDLGNSGFFQFIPLYFFWMIFENSQNKTNPYGLNPKEIIVPLSHKIKTKKIIQLYIDKEDKNIIIHESSSILLNTLLIIIIFEYVSSDSIWYYIGLMVSIIFCYFLMLIITTKNNFPTTNKKHNTKQRLIYASLLFICIRIYFLCFGNSYIEIQTIYFELFLVFLFYAFTYISIITYKAIFTNQITENES